MGIALITGINGFVGSHLGRRLALDGWEVVGTSRTPSPGNLTCDIADGEAVEALVADIKPDLIVHFAAISSVTAGTPIEYYINNVIGTENILGAAKRLPGRPRFVFLSSAGVYGNQDVEILSEDLCPKPVHHYGISKFACERIIANASDKLDWTIVRPFNIVGVGQHHSFIFPKLAMAFARGDRQIRLGNIDVYRDFIDIDSACEIIVKLAGLTSCNNEIVNLCSSKGTSIGSLISKLEEVAGYDIEVVSAPEFTRKNEIWKLLGSRTKLDRLIEDDGKMMSATDTLVAMFEAYRRSQAGEGARAGSGL